MGYHPHYLENFLRTQHFILRGDGPLPYDYRHYIAIMAAGRHQCSYLINLQRQEFLLQGGDEKWLQGLDCIPAKLRDLYEINKLLAHRPWLINKHHIEKLTKGTDSWSLGEVFHAIVLLAHFHALASFVYGCGINTELDHENGHSFRPASSLNDGAGSDGEQGGCSPPGSDTEGGVETLMRRMKTLSQQQQEPSQEEMVKRFERVEKQTLELSAGVEVIATPKADISCFINDPGFMYQDFAKCGHMTDIPTFRIQDYSWDDHGYSLANELYCDVGTLLDEKFKKAYDLTYYTMGGKRNVDTSMFRRAVWNYIQCIFGIRHDDYDYGEVNQLLEKSLKAYIKTVCCYPERTTRRDYDSVMRDFRHSEKVHVNLMLVEARLQAELLYALRVITQYMT